MSIFEALKERPSRATMCGTVAWLQVKACGDDEQFDLAAWFLSLKYRAGHMVASFYIFVLYG